MQHDPHYDDVVCEVKAFLEERLSFAVAHGRRRGADPARPGDRVRQDDRAQPRVAAAARRARGARAPGRDRDFAQVIPGKITGREVDDRIAATIATNVLAYERGARVFRVHDVAPVHDALAVMAATVTRAMATTPTSTTI